MELKTGFEQISSNSKKDVWHCWQVQPRSYRTHWQQSTSAVSRMCWGGKNAWGRFSSNSVGATAGRSQSGHLGRVGVRAVQAPLLSLQRHEQRPAPPPPPASSPRPGRILRNSGAGPRPHASPRSSLQSLTMWHWPGCRLPQRSPFATPW